MEHVTIFLNIVFVAITFTTVFVFYKATNYSRLFLIVCILWMIFQGVLSINNFYISEQPRFLLLLLPPVLTILALFSSKTGRSFINSLSLPDLTLLHTVRIPVEVVLYYLFLAKAIPEIMTFEGRNFDIIAGITAPFIYYFGFKANKIPAWGIILWNLICIGLLTNIVVVAILSSKTPLQQFAFEQPNIAITYFPFSWLPSVVVPLVLLSHIAAVKQLVEGNFFQSRIARKATN